MNAKGFGFVRIEGSNHDVMVREENKGMAIDGDRVQFTVIKDRNGKREGIILNVLERARMQLVGTIQVRNHKAILYPDSAKYGVPVEIPESKLNGAQQGMRAVVKITVWPEQRKMPYGEVVALLGYAGTNDAEMISILINQGFDPFFPDEVLREASLISTEITNEEMYLMNSNIFSISPEVIASEKSFGRLNTELRKLGFLVEEIQYSEIAKMEGLLRCSTMPLRRRNA